MGLFNFIKEAGASVFSGDQSENLELESEKKIMDFVRQNFHFGVKEFAVNVEGDTAIISGDATTQAEREKIILAVGNIEGIGQVKDQLRVSSAAVETIEVQPRFYVVKKGDTLGKIAKEFYGDPMKYPEIFEANKPMLDNADNIYPGQTLRIPE